MYRFERLRPEQLADFSALTFPYFRARLDDEPEAFFAVGASLGASAVGLALAERAEDARGLAQIHSLAVDAAHRRRGVARELLRHTDEGLASLGFEGALASIMEGGPCSAAVDALLDRAGYGLAVRRLLICESDFATITRAPWMARRPFPDGYEVVPWVELRTEELRAVEQQGRAGAYPETSSPLPSPELVEPRSSLALRRHGTVVGWCITHRMRRDTIRFFRLFVRRDLQPLGRAAQLLSESIWRHEGTEVDKAYFDIAAHNTAMLRFAERRLRPWLLSMRWIVRRARRYAAAARRAS